MEATKLVAKEPTSVVALVVDRSRDFSVRPLVDRRRLERSTRTAWELRSLMEPT